MANSKYRVLIVARHPVGGIRTFIRYVYTNFDRQKYSLTLLAPDVPDLDILHEDLEGLAEKFIRIDKNGGLLDFLRAIWNTLRRGCFDIVHSQGFTSGVLTSVPARVFRIPHIMTSHDILQSSQFPGVRGRLKKLSLSYSLPLVDLIHCVTEDAERNLLEFIPALRRHRKRVMTIRNGIEIDRFLSEEREDLRKKLKLGDDVFIIGFLGRFMSQKGFKYLLEAVAQLKKNSKLPKRPVVLTFGKGDGFYREEMEIVKKMELQSSVFFLEPVPNIADIIRNFDVLAIPSLWEACGLVAMEGMVAGVPVIGTDCIGLREVLQDTPAIAVPVRDAATLADAIIKEMKNPSKAKFEAFAHEAAERFDVKVQARELEKVMLSLIGKEKYN